MDMLLTERLILRKFTDNDWSDLYEYLSKDSVVKYEPYNIYTLEECKQEAINRSNQDEFWAVCLKENNKLIGNLYFQHQEPKELLTWEIGYVFNPEYYGKGYALESCRKIMDYGFKQLNARRIVAMCNPKNIASWKLLERLNMRREGHLRKNIYFKYDEKGMPIWNDTYEYAILTEENIKKIDYTIGKGNINDIDELEKLYNNLNAYLESSINYPGWAKGIYPIREIAISGIENNNLFVLRINDEIAGSIILNHEPENAYDQVDWGIATDYNHIIVIHTLVVHPKYMKNGVGKKLMDFAKIYSKEQKMKTIRLDVSIHNTPAISLYERCGYKYVGTVDLGLNVPDLVWFKLYELIL